MDPLKPESKTEIQLEFKIEPLEPIDEPTDPKEEGPRPGEPFVSVTNPNLSEEQRRVYEDVLNTTKKERRFICRHCSKEFKNNQNLYLHTTRVHSTVESAVVCDVCDKTYKNKHYLHMHKINKHSSDTDVSLCQFCNQEFRTKKSLEVHLKRAHKDSLPEIRCPECHKDFDMPSRLRKHMKIHATADYKCKLCDRSYKNQMSFDRHSRTHETTEKFPCVFCPMTFKTKYHTKRHVLNVHPPLESKATCPEGKKHFKNDMYLKDHMQVHTTLEKKIPCDLCGKKFHSPKSLDKHKKTVHPPGGKKYRCAQCDKEFAHDSYLRYHINMVHMNAKSSEWQHPCGLCGKKFKTDKHLKRHLKRHDKQKAEIADGGKVQKRPGRKSRQEIEFIKCERMTSSESGSGTETESESKYERGDVMPLSK